MTDASDLALVDDDDDEPPSHVLMEDVLPGEDLVAREQLKEAYLEELNPVTAYEWSLADQLANYEWEIMRHRRMRDATVLLKYQRLATNVIMEGDPNHDAWVSEIDEETRLFALDLTSKDPQTRQEAEAAFLQETQWHPHQLLALASGSSEEAKHHDTKIADLERRRRALRKDYDELKVTHARVVEDAEVMR
ncbi:hypothetical protein N8I71_12930 [Roseibacterium sp. SDUM158016]|uniref:hypothetical protein n=1 Tax=Roseicyclus sediminis TaxID=2980997 RepID=UPI0021D396E1|nr:hypothetical protein [Roseibacterium sp. SDUM158016]MCU4653741.1 hypothetical protein [Roseibacterium sp. SDUM158016]